MTHSGEGWLIGFHMALETARECLRRADQYDDPETGYIDHEWHERMRTAAAYHRATAREYLRRHRLTLGYRRAA